MSFLLSSGSPGWPPARCRAASQRESFSSWGALGGASVAALPQLGPALARLAEDHPPAGPGRTRVQIQSLVDAGVRDLAGLMEGLGALEQPAHGA